ncbi:MAG TPA: hypothetical protein VFL95_01445, partial [Gemmatimonadales bacterium]|nr:hypothetical protein [Gemmatimonadales bacterium]
PRDPVLLTMLLTDNPALTLQRLRASSAEVNRAEAAVRAQPEPPGSDSAAVRHWLAAVGGAADDLLHLWRLRTGAAAPWAAEVEAIRRRGDPLDRGALAVTGNDLLQSGVPPGPELGRILDRLLDRVLDEPALNNRDALLELARSLAGGSQ